LGEFGAVSVVSGHIRGLTDTIPLHIEILYNENNLVGAFSLAATLAAAAIAVTLLRSVLERRELPERAP
jgi:sulfate/thiosulfate transport system permease protein